MLALTLVRLYSPNSFPLFYQRCHWLSKRTYRVMLLPMALLANNDCAIETTGSSSNSLKAVGLLDSVKRSQLVLYCVHLIQNAFLIGKCSIFTKYF